jgi:predicted ATPase/DNA-binding CsgD family transcriptional regulator
LSKVSLTDREREILRLLTLGRTDSEIAKEAILTVGTVKWYNRQIYNKLGVRNRTEAITRAQQLGLLGNPLRPDLLSARPAQAHNLPAQVTSFIGRHRELAELKTLLLDSRLITLTGPPGTGKTRLALEVASTLLEHYRDGVYFVSLAPLRDASLVAHTIAQTIDVKESAGDSILVALKGALRDKKLLLVMDNFEHVLAAATLVSDLLAAAPRLTVLATSREILRLYGEQDFPVPPLQLPDLQQQSSAPELQSYEAVELFIQRAHAAQPAFSLGDDNAAAVAMICVHLDGLPLAIELAAAHIKFYTPPMLLLRLSHRLEALGEGARDLPARQRTLRATLAWSYGLLTPEEQCLFARLGVFVGGFSIADAEAVCSDHMIVNVGAELISLLNKSLLQQMPNVMDEARFMMLETMREYALEKLVERDEIERIQEKHARYFLAFVERAAQEWATPREAAWLARLEVQHDNLRAALNWSLAHDQDAQTSLRFVAGLAPFWRTRGNPSEGRAWFADALQLKGADAPTHVRAEALRGAGGIAYLQCDYSAAREFYQEALDIHQQLGDQRGFAHALVGFADMELAIGAYDAAETSFQQAVQIMRQIGDQDGVAWASCLMAWCPLRSRGDYPQAIAWLEQGLALYEQMGNRTGTALAYSGLGEIAVRQGKLAQAIPLLEESLRLRQELGEKWGIAASLGSLAWTARLQGDFERATALLGESLHIRQDINDPGGIAWCLEELAEIAHVYKDDGLAARILGAAASLRTGVSSAIDPIDLPEYDRLIAEIRAQLGDDVYEAVWAEGQMMPLENFLEVLPISPGTDATLI